MRLETSFARTGRWGGRIAALTAALLTVASPAFAATVKSVSMKEAGSATQVVIEGDAPLNYHDFTLESPDRIVVYDNHTDRHGPLPAIGRSCGCASRVPFLDGPVSAVFSPNTSVVFFVRHVRRARFSIRSSWISRRLPPTP